MEIPACPRSFWPTLRGVCSAAASPALLLACAVLGACAPLPGALAEALPREAPPSLPADAEVPPLLAAPDVPLPGPAPRQQLAFVAGVGLADDASCARCHDEIAAEWQSSLHRHAWQNDYFRRSYANETKAICRGCHEPSADPSAEPSLAAREVGVGCTTCHVATAGIVGSRPLPARPGGHVVLGDARLATPAACGGCHDFPFPDDADGAGPRQQDTLGEHRRSAAAEKPCQGCHMPLAASRAGGEHHDHTFRVQGDRAMLARAVRVTSATLEDGKLTLSLAPGEIGHAFPTGDVFRRAEVRVTPIDEAGAPLGPEVTQVLARTFGHVQAPNGGLSRVVRADTRIVDNRLLKLSLSPRARRARFQIVWQRLPPDLAERLGMTPRDHETVVHEGTVSR